MEPVKDRRHHGDSVHPDAQDPEAQVGPDAWITEIQTYLKDNILPDDSASADRIARLAKRYTLVEGDLYRRGTIVILMRCITQEEGCELLAEVHGGECGNHASSHTVTPTFYKNKKNCANRNVYKNAYQIIVLMKNFPKINLV
jgi:hypothetical protein